MAKITLDRDDCRNDFLPKRCMRCGVRTEQIVTRTFAWASAFWYLLLCTGIGAMFFVIIRNFFAKRMTVDLPLCPKHQNHWMKNALMILFLIFANIGVMYAVVQFTEKKSSSFANILLYSTLILFLASMVFVVMLSYMQIYPTYINEDSIDLAGVHQKFRQELIVLQAEAEEAYRASRAKQKRRPANEPQKSDETARVSRKRQPDNNPASEAPFIIGENKKKKHEPPNEMFKFD